LETGADKNGLGSITHIITISVKSRQTVLPPCGEGGGGVGCVRKKRREENLAVNYCQGVHPHPPPAVLELDGVVKKHPKQKKHAQ
jgi:hypothetical protein